MSENQNYWAQKAQLAYLALLADMADPDQFLEVRWRPRAARMRRRFVSVGRLGDVALLIRLLAPENDVYVGVAPRDGSGHGGRAAIGALHLAYIESDHAATAERLAAFAHPPTMVIASGTPGHHQVYWLLDRRYPPPEVEAANRRLARALGGDPACADSARILRPPGTLNHKQLPARPVTLLVLREHARSSLAQLTEGLPADPSPTAAGRLPAQRRASTVPLDGDLRAIPAAEYVRVLAGLVPDGEGKVLCPFHRDRNPSLQLYGDGGFYCFGSGCGAGGTIFDFASRMWGVSPRGAGFVELRERLAVQFGLTRTSPS
jgi:hypothetical protein